jgi:hypothetical protein
MTRDRITIKSSNSPIDGDGGSVRVYVGDSLVWQKRVTDLQELLTVEHEVRLILNSKHGKPMERLLRLV